MEEEIRYIWHFDDGMQDKKFYTNKWIVVEKKYNGGKLVLKNFDLPHIIINTISEWKTRLYNPDDVPY
jgi:hypothetical protein